MFYTGMTSISFAKTFTSLRLFLGKKPKQVAAVVKNTQPAGNRVEPLQTEFKTTKELFSYARGRCVDALKSETPYEHAVIVDTKKNKVVAEYIGGPEKCNMDDLAQLNLDKDNTIIFHPHPNGFPVSRADVNVLLNTNVTQVVAFDKNGKFSLVAKTAQTPLKPDKACKKYVIASQEEAADSMGLEPQLRALSADYVLKKHAPLMGLRYVSNYDYLR